MQNVSEDAKKKTELPVTMFLTNASTIVRPCSSTLKILSLQLPQIPTLVLLILLQSISVCNRNPVLQT